MHPTRQQLTREQMAWQEVGHTSIRPLAARILLGVFLLITYAIPTLQVLTHLRSARAHEETIRMALRNHLRETATLLEPFRREGLRLAPLLEVNRTLLQRISQCEDRIDDESAFARLVRPHAQLLFARLLGVGNEQVYLGHAPWLFYRADIDSLTDPPFLSPRQLARRAASGNEWLAPPQPDPRKAILEFKQQLADRGIELLLVPTPVKPSIHPGHFSSRYRHRARPLHNPSYQSLIDELRNRQVHIYDPADDMLDHAADHASPAPYLATDTHWRPEAMEATARRIATLIRQKGWLGTNRPLALTRRDIDLASPGDTTLMLDLPAHQTLYPHEHVTIRQVLGSDGHLWRSSPDAPVLVLGDSFSNIYSLEAMGWGESAGLVEQLAYHLGMPVDRLVRNDAGAHATRQMLSRELARGRDRLEGKQLVIWQFAARELAHGDWRLIPMELLPPPSETFLEMAPGETLTVTGRLQSLSSTPRPGTVPYRDHVIALHLVDLPHDQQALVYIKSMIDNEWTPAARLREGETVTLELQPWADVADRYEAINRSELDDLELQLQEPCWGVLEKW